MFPTASTNCQTSTSTITLGSPVVVHIYMLQPAQAPTAATNPLCLRHRSPGTSSFLHRHAACAHHLQRGGSSSRQPSSSRLLMHAEQQNAAAGRERLKAGGPMYSPTSPQAWDVMRQALADAGVRARCGHARHAVATCMHACLNQPAPVNCLNQCMLEPSGPRACLNQLVGTLWAAVATRASHRCAGASPSHMAATTRADLCCSCLGLAAGEDGEPPRTSLRHGERHRHNSGCAA